jgi:glutamine synthetase
MTSFFFCCVQVAAAVLDWARDNGATSYCHWTQPLGGALLRHGMTATVQNAMMEFDTQGNLFWNFKGKHLLKSETDGSSYNNGGLRTTHTAAAYCVIDATSPIFQREDTIFIPAALVGYTGTSLDEKTPLLKATTALSEQGTRLLKLLGVTTDGISCNIGLEQEFFFVPRDKYLQRPDLQFTGRTLIGRPSARGQELCDHCKFDFQ